MLLSNLPPTAVEKAKTGELSPVFVNDFSLIFEVAI